MRPVGQSFRNKWGQVSRISAAFEYAAKGLDMKIAAAVELVGREIEHDAKQAVPVDTGFLKQRIKYRKRGFRGLGARIGSNVPYAPYVEFGTGGKVKVPKGWEDFALQFKANPRIREVNLRARPYLIPAYKKGVAKLRVLLGTIVKE